MLKVSIVFIEVLRSVVNAYFSRLRAGAWMWRFRGRRQDDGDEGVLDDETLSKV